MNNEEELFETCIELRRRVNDLEDKIQEILDFLVKTHITVHEMEEVQMIVEGDDDLSIK